MTARSSIPREQGEEQGRSARHCHYLAWEVTFYFCHKLLALLRFKSREHGFLSRQREGGLSYNMWVRRYPRGNLWKIQSASLTYVKSQPLCTVSPNYFRKITVYFLCVVKNKLCIYHLIWAVLFSLFTSLFLSAAVSSGWWKVCCYSRCTITFEKPAACARLHKRVAAAFDLCF